MSRATCNSCLYEFNVDAKLIGKRVRCPECGSFVVVGATATAALPPRVGARGGSEKDEVKRLITIGGGAGLFVGLFIAGFMLFRGAGDTVVQPPPMAMNPPAGSAVEPPEPISASLDDPAEPSPNNDDPVDDEEPVDNGNEPAPRRLVGKPIPSSGEGGSKTRQTSADPNGPSAIIGPPEDEMKTVGGDGERREAAGLIAERSETLELVDLISIVEPSVVRLNVVTEKGFSQGSGFVSDDSGTVITNFHVIEGANKVYAIFSDGREAEVSGYRFFDAARDIAVLQLELPKDAVPAIPIATDLPRKGETVYGFGSPQGLDFTTSQGIISAVRPEQQMHEVAEELGNLKGTWLQTTAAISGGSSGGPLIDTTGNVVGINSLTMISGQNLNFAISCVDLRDAYAQASSQVKPFRAEELRPPVGQGTRELAGDEIDTDRGNTLFADVDEIILVNLAPENDAKVDSTGRIWASVVAHSEHAIEQLDIELSFGEPSPDAAVMMILMELKPDRKKGNITHEMELSADLVCFDPTAPSSRRYVRVWHGDAKIGTVSPQALARGVVPNQMAQALREFFGDFRRAQGAATRAAEEADD